MEVEGEEKNRQQKGGPDQPASMENYLHRRKLHDCTIKQTESGLSRGTDRQESGQGNQPEPPGVEGLTLNLPFLRHFLFELS